MAVTNCPDQRALSDLAMGRLPEEQIDDVGSHIEQCEGCLELLSKREKDPDALLSVLASSTPECEIKHEPEYVDAFSTIKMDIQTPICASDLNECASMGTIEKYKLIRKIGSGGMGTVYEGQHPNLNRRVALKVLQAKFPDKDDGRKRFNREIQIIGKLEHPNIVRVSDAGNDGTHGPYLVMELLDGRTLSDLVKSRGRLAVPDCCELIRQAALGLAYAHDNNVIHRDMKPGNLMLTPSGNVKIVDFGLSILSDRSIGGELTEPDQVLGTRSYMSPEQVKNSKDVSTLTDIFSLGLRFLTLLRGEAPIHSESPEERFLVKGERVIGLNSSLECLINRMIKREPNDRISANDVAIELSKFAKGHQVAKLLDEEYGVPIPGPKPFRIGMALWIAAIVALLFGIVIYIKDRNGKILGTLDLPEGTKAEIRGNNGDLLAVVDADDKSVKSVPQSNGSVKKPDHPDKENGEAGKRPVSSTGDIHIKGTQPLFLYTSEWDFGLCPSGLISKANSIAVDQYQDKMIVEWSKEDRIETVPEIYSIKNNGRVEMRVITHGEGQFDQMEPINLMEIGNFKPDDTVYIEILAATNKPTADLRFIIGVSTKAGMRGSLPNRELKLDSREFPRLGEFDPGVRGGGFTLIRIPLKGSQLSAVYDPFGIIAINAQDVKVYLASIRIKAE